MFGPSIDSFLMALEAMAVHLFFTETESSFCFGDDYRSVRLKFQTLGIPRSQGHGVPGSLTFSCCFQCPTLNFTFIAPHLPIVSAVVIHIENGSINNVSVNLPKPLRWIIHQHVLFLCPGGLTMGYK